MEQSTSRKRIWKQEKALLTKSRKKHLAIRDAMSESEKHEKSRKICDNLLKSDWYAKTDWIFGYYPLGKADCLAFLQTGVVMENMSRCHGRTDCTCKFYSENHIFRTDIRERGAFHVMEPTNWNATRINPWIYTTNRSSLSSGSRLYPHWQPLRTVRTLHSLFCQLLSKALR